MKKELISLRQIMAEQNIDYYIIPTTDFHGSEYVNDYFKCRKFVSGFSGSAGTLVISQDEAFLWADGRYFLQAAAQLKGSGIELMKMGEPGVPMIQEYLESKKTPYVLGFDGRLANATEGRAYESIPGVDVVWNKDLVGMFWSDRPAIVPSEVRALPLDITGKSAEDKMRDVRKAMADKGASCVLFNCREEIAWLFNLRGNDVEDTPVFFSFALVTAEKAQLFVMDGAVCEDI
ncbi:MAG: aminopeptidase P family protein, partial [Clostridiales bacterium]|nr:aminopeptidase P family protein [Clostridiales bacterium]